MYDGLLEVPLLIKFPFSARTGPVDTFINLPDVFATIPNVCDIVIPEEISGKPFGNTPSSSIAEMINTVPLKNFSSPAQRVIYEDKYKYLDVGGCRGSRRTSGMRRQLLRLFTLTLFLKIRNRLGSPLQATIRQSALMTAASRVSSPCNNSLTPGCSYIPDFFNWRGCGMGLKPIFENSATIGKNS